MEAMNEYVKPGDIGGIALSEVSAETIRRAAKVAKITAVEIELSLWNTEPLENGVVQACAELDIPIIAYGKPIPPCPKLTTSLAMSADFTFSSSRQRHPNRQDQVI